jgi:hypothetical protein
LADIFNDKQRVWLHAEIGALSRFDIRAVAARSPRELRDKMPTLFKEVNDWHAAFHKSGGPGLQLWDWSAHPVAEVFMKLDPASIQTICTSTVNADGLPMISNTEAS